MSRQEFLRGRPLYLGARPNDGCPKCGSTVLNSHSCGISASSYECEDGFEFECHCGYEWVEIYKENPKGPNEDGI